MAISKWWPVGLFITSIILFAVGGGLIGGSLGSSSSYYYGYLYYYTNNSMFYAGLALIVIGGLVKISFLVALFLFCVQRRRSNRSQHNYIPPPVQYPPVDPGRVEGGFHTYPVPPQPMYNTPWAGIHTPHPSPAPTPVYDPVHTS